MFLSGFVYTLSNCPGLDYNAQHYSVHLVKILQMIMCKTNICVCTDVFSYCMFALVYSFKIVGRVTHCFCSYSAIYCTHWIVFKMYKKWIIQVLIVHKGFIMYIIMIYFILFRSKAYVVKPINVWKNNNKNNNNTHTHTKSCQCSVTRSF